MDQGTKWSAANSKESGACADAGAVFLTSPASYYSNLLGRNHA